MMKPNHFSALIGLLLGSVIIAPVSADSRLDRNDSTDRRHDERREVANSSFKNKLKETRNKDKYLVEGARKQNQKDHRKNSKHDNRSDQRRAGTQRKNPRESNRNQKHTKRDHSYRDYRNNNRLNQRFDFKDSHRHDGRNYARDKSGYEVRHGKRLILRSPRHRTFRNIFITRPFGHSYYGYGHFLNDNNAWRWLTFTAITLKLLDMVDEQAQRQHEAAQIEATTADVGEKIYWDTGDASGYVVTTREGSTSRGLPCREYQQSITVGDRTERAYGKACLQNDGAWKIVD